MNYQEALDWLYGTQLFGIKLGLENTRRLLRANGVSEDLAQRQVIHVAGTNGKGSVCAFTEQILRDGGVRTGLFTSPHLVSFRERIRVEGRLAPEEAIAREISRLRALTVDWDPHPTFFELTLAIALRIFCDEDVEIVVLETGMGGRLDATTAVESDLCAITRIGLDHRQWLGDTLAEIAEEKAGIIHHPAPVIIADLDPVARDVVGKRALAVGVPCVEAHPLPEGWKTGIPGHHQRENAAIAVELACRAAGNRLSRDGIQRSVVATVWPARFQRVGERLILDGAHNPQAAAALADTWKAECGDETATVIFGVAESKDVTGMVSHLRPLAKRVFLCPIRSQRSLATSAMREAWASAPGPPVPCRAFDEFTAAWEAAKEEDGPILVTGSLFLAGEALSEVEGIPFEVSEQ